MIRTVKADRRAVLEFQGPGADKGLGRVAVLGSGVVNGEGFADVNPERPSNGHWKFPRLSGSSS